MKGYYRDPETTASRMSRHGFHTGDYAYADRGWFSLLPGAAGRHFQVGGREDQRAGDRRRRDGARGGRRSGGHAVARSESSAQCPSSMSSCALEPSCTERELQTFCARRLSRHKIPRAVHFVDELAQDVNRQGSEIPAQGSAPVKSGETASVVGRAATVPWGCWDPEATLELRSRRASPCRSTACATAPDCRPPPSASAVRRAVRLEAITRVGCRRAHGSHRSRRHHAAHADRRGAAADSVRARGHSARKHQDSRRARRASSDGPCRARKEARRRHRRRVRRRAAPSRTRTWSTSAGPAVGRRFG